jgi:hypothetical protein
MRAPAEIRAAGGRRELARYHVREDENGSSLYSMGQRPRYKGMALQIEPSTKEK